MARRGAHGRRKADGGGFAQPFSDPCHERSALLHPVVVLVLLEFLLHGAPGDAVGAILFSVLILRGVEGLLVDLLSFLGRLFFTLSGSCVICCSVFYHAAEGGQVYSKYIDDAEKEGDHELVDFFREVQEQDANRAQKAKSLLRRR